MIDFRSWCGGGGGSGFTKKEIDGVRGIYKSMDCTWNERKEGSFIRDAIYSMQRDRNVSFLWGGVKIFAIVCFFFFQGKRNNKENKERSIWDKKNMAEEKKG